MPRLLLDQGARPGLRRILIGFDVKTAREMGWDTISNAVLLAVAEKNGFSILVTADQNIRSQLNLTGRRVAIVVTIGSRSERILKWSSAPAPEQRRELNRYPRPHLVRRPPPNVPM